MPNLLDADVEALVNTVNTVGVMGKGLALQFKQRFPANFKVYAEACRRGEVQVGRMLVVETGLYKGPRYIINFPTKVHWRDPSQIAYIQAGLTALVQEIQHRAIQSLAIPPLGCGNGGLSWVQVKPLIEQAVKALSGVHMEIFEPPSHNLDNSPTPQAVPQLSFALDKKRTL